MGADALAPLPFSLWEKVARVSRPDEGFSLKDETRLARETLTPDPLPLERERPSLVELARFLRQHNRNPIADRIGQPCGARNELLPNRIVSELCPRHGAHQDLQEASIDFRAARLV